MKNYIVGDVHGTGMELAGLLHEVNFEVGKDKLWLVGDVFDRGFYPHMVWGIIEQTKATVIKGNHEVKMLRYIQRKTQTVPPHYDYALRRMMGNGITIPQIVEFIESLPMLLVVPGTNVIVTHGGVCLDNPLRESADANVYGHFDPKQPMPRPRQDDGNDYWWDHYHGEHLVIYGHLVNEDGTPRRRPGSIGIDTGACHGLPLTAYCVETKAIHQFKSGVNQFGMLKTQFKHNRPEPVFVT